MLQIKREKNRAVIFFFFWLEGKKAVLSVWTQETIKEA